MMATRPKLYPDEMVRGTRSLSEGEFARTWSDMAMLLIRIDDSSSELCQWLISTSASAGQGAPLIVSADAMPFSTRLNSFGQMGAAHSQRRISVDAIIADLDYVSYFVAPLRKRASEAKPFAERISVGRARNNDIVLRHPTVSKFHAWFQCDDDHEVDELFLTDAKSTNRTSVAGHRLQPGESRKVDIGVEIKFGDVLCIVCSPKMVRELVMRTSP
jgi:hypothetical protein